MGTGHDTIRDFQSAEQGFRVTFAACQEVYPCTVFGGRAMFAGSDGSFSSILQVTVRVRFRGMVRAACGVQLIFCRVCYDLRQ